MRTYCKAVIVIGLSKLLKLHLTAKSTAPAYSRALRRIRFGDMLCGQWVVQGMSRSGCQKVIDGKVAVYTVVSYSESGEAVDRMSQGIVYEL